VEDTLIIGCILLLNGAMLRLNSGLGSSLENDHLIEDYEIILRVIKGGVLGGIRITFKTALNY
jgi:hypothetical protein